MNDMLPEEQDPQFEELIALLRQADLNPPFIDPTQYAQIISQARARLFPTDYETSQTEMQELGPLSSKPKAQRAKHGRLVHLLNVIAAVLVVALLIGSTLLLFGPLLRDRFVTTPSRDTFGAPRKVGNLEMSLKITSGPYFLNELLEVDLMVINPTHTLYSLAPKGPVDPLCSQLLNIVTTDGGSPHAIDFQHYWDPILGPSRNCSPLSPGIQTGFGIPVLAHQTITYKQYVQLTSSGHVTLTANLVSLRIYTQTGSGSGIFAGALEDTLHLFVNPHTPSDRQLSMQEQNAQVVVSGPPAVNGHLFGRIGSVCPGPEGGKDIGGLGQPSGTTVIVKPDSNVCSANGPKPLWWTYVVGAPGYALVSGRVNG
jgi:hypothetical protein